MSLSLSVETVVPLREYWFHCSGKKRGSKVWNKLCFEQTVLQISNCNSYNYENKPSICFLREKKIRG